MAKKKVCAPRAPRKPTPVPPYMVPPTKPQVVPSIVVEGVASIFLSRMGHVLDEVARRDIRCRPTMYNIHRSSLLSMCLVSKSWAETCKRILRRRVVVTSVAAMKSLLRSGFPGNEYVLELIYMHDTSDIYNVQNPNGRSHWLLLADLLSSMPNLRFLCVDVRDFADDHDILDDEDDMEESDMDEDGYEESEDDTEEEGEDHSIEDGVKNPVDDSGSSPEELQANVPEESEEDKEWDKERGVDIEVDFTGIRVALRAIGRLVHLTGLVMLADFVVDMEMTPKLMRYCPYFIHICEQLPKLKNLSYLRLRGFSSHHNEEGIESFAGVNIVTSRAPFPDILVGISPPPSLKTLVLELPAEWIPYNAVMWLLNPQNAFGLENLLLRFEAAGDQLETLLTLSRRFDTPMPHLRNFRFEFWDDGTLIVVAPTVNKVRGQIAKSILEKMSALRSLHVPPALVGKLPDTLEELHFLYDSVANEDDMDEDFDDFDEERPDWFKRDMALVSALRVLSLPRLVKKITVAITNDQERGESPGLDDMEMWLPMSEKQCEEMGIEVEIAEDRLFESRMVDFLLHGRTKCSSDDDYEHGRPSRY
ncbi:hypothetical protein SCHPADRAFT_1001269 [Schizopora paradoxa]|uniref:Uncharacterized protein n=1 Tax=Schizopora paradoxa TaxID=27342 RepID=A0A0H2R819_9AGAM|nr:hypothetical protein SCHPADRAFT_1001269 [Schizopora paradoxa]